MKTSKRKSGIELLRIIAIIQIIFLHAYQYGGFGKAAADYLCGKEILVMSAYSLCRAPVDVFVMISGYFMITSEFNIRKTLRRAKKPYEAMIFYSAAISLIFFIADPGLITPPNVCKAFLPFLSRTWYFLDNYIIILLISPFLNKMLSSLSKRQYLYFLGVIFAVVSVWSTLAHIDGINQVVSTKKILDQEYGKSLGGFLLMYITGGYLRLFVGDKKNGREKPNLIYMGAFLALCMLDLALYGFVPQYRHVFGMFDNPIVLCESACLILFFRDFKFSSSVINLLASTTLGVYAIHEHYFMRKWIWSVLSFKDKALFEGFIFIPVVMGGCLAVFICCSLTELLRERCFSLIHEKISARKRKKAENRST